MLTANVTRSRGDPDCTRYYDVSCSLVMTAIWHRNEGDGSLLVCPGVGSVG